MEATYTNTTYGFRGTGGNSATTVTTSPTLVKSFILIATTGADTATITDKDGTAIMILKGPATAGEFSQVWFDNNMLNGLIVTLSTTNAVLLIITK